MYFLIKDLLNLKHFQDGQENKLDVHSRVADLFVTMYDAWFCLCLSALNLVKVFVSIEVITPQRNEIE